MLPVRNFKLVRIEPDNKFFDQEDGYHHPFDLVRVSQESELKNKDREVSVEATPLLFEFLKKCKIPKKYLEITRVENGKCENYGRSAYKPPMTRCSRVSEDHILTLMFFTTEQPYELKDIMTLEDTNFSPFKLYMNDIHLYDPEMVLNIYFPIYKIKLYRFDVFGSINWSAINFHQFSYPFENYPIHIAELCSSKNEFQDNDEFLMRIHKYSDYYEHALTIICNIHNIELDFEKNWGCRGDEHFKVKLEDTYGIYYENSAEPEYTTDLSSVRGKIEKIWKEDDYTSQILRQIKNHIDNGAKDEYHKDYLMSQLHSLKFEKDKVYFIPLTGSYSFWRGFDHSIYSEIFSDCETDSSIYKYIYSKYSESTSMLSISNHPCKEMAFRITRSPYISDDNVQVVWCLVFKP